MSILQPCLVKYCCLLIQPSHLAKLAPTSHEPGFIWEERGLPPPLPEICSPLLIGQLLCYLCFRFQWCIRIMIPKPPSPQTGQLRQLGPDPSELGKIAILNQSSQLFNSQPILQSTQEMCLLCLFSTVLQLCFHNRYIGQMKELK